MAIVVAHYSYIARTFVVGTRFDHHGKWHDIVLSVDCIITCQGVAMSGSFRLVCCQGVTILPICWHYTWVNIGKGREGSLTTSWTKYQVPMVKFWRIFAKALMLKKVLWVTPYKQYDDLYLTLLHYKLGC